MTIGNIESMSISDIEEAKLKAHYTFAFRNYDEAFALADKIHNALVGNPDYIDSRIILNVDEVDDDNMRLVQIWVMTDAATKITGGLKITTSDGKVTMIEE